MLLTEEQYKEKWCPEARRVVQSHGATILSGVNLDEAGERAGNCVASKCAMWRWHGKNCAHELPPKPSEASKPNKVDCDCSPKGYCGLAGKP